MLDGLRNAGFDIQALHHAEAILTHDMPEALRDIEAVLGGLRIPVAELVAGGGGEAKLTQRLRKAFADRGWKKKKIELKKTVDGREVASLSHEIDHVKAFSGHLIALEVEWNNKDPFFDRDLENYKRLHADNAISVGIIITRGASLQAELRPIILEFAQRNQIAALNDLDRFRYNPTDRQRREIERRRKNDQPFPKAWSEAFVADKFGEATTHWKKLGDRIRRGVGNPCPLLLIGIPAAVVTQEE